MSFKPGRRDKTEEIVDSVRAVGRRYAYAHSYRQYEVRDRPYGYNRSAFGYLENAVRMPLPAAEPSLLAVDGIWNGQVGSQGPRDAGASFALRLSTLLRFNLGVITADFSDPSGACTLHRAVPSPGQLYASEICVHLPHETQLSQGTYHYDVPRHELALISDGCSSEARLERALGIDIFSTEAVLIVGSVLWRLVQKYTNVSYRLAALEAGHLVGNLMLTASALGWHSRVHYLFNDDLLEEHLGLPERSASVMAVVSLHADGPPATKGRLGPNDEARRGSAPHLRMPNRAVWQLHPEGGERMPRSAEVESMEAASRVKVEPGTFVDPFGWNPMPDLPEGDTVHLGPSARPERNLLDALRARNSGGSLSPYGLSTAPFVVPEAWLSFVLRHCGHGYANDIDAEHSGFLNRVSLVVVPNRVEGLSQGAYQWVPDLGVLKHLASAPIPDRLLKYERTINASALGVVWAIFANYEPVIQRFGARGYRIINLEAGLLAQRLCLLSAAVGLFARPFCAFNEQRLDRWLGLENLSHMPIYLALSGLNGASRLRFAVDLEDEGRLRPRSRPISRIDDL